MANQKVVLSPDPLYLQGSGADPTSYDAASDRKFMQDVMSEGVRDGDDFAISVLAGMAVRAAAGVAYILGRNVADQGMYRQYRASATDITAPAAHGSLPRLDQVILRVMDYTHDNNGGGLYEGRLEWIEGTATSGATLDNRLGAASLDALPENSKNTLLLADYLMASGTSSLSGANLRDKRSRSVVGAGLAVGGTFMPGEIKAWPSNTLPDPTKYGVWLWLDGASYLRNDYPDLFDSLGGTGSPWGLPDGTHFNVPDARGRGLVMRNAAHPDVDNLADNEGAPLSSRTPKHKTSINDPGHTHGFPIYPAAAGGGAPDGTSNQPPSSYTPTQLAYTGIVAGVQSNVPTDTGAYLTVNYIIKA